MEQVVLGRSGLEVSPICFGTWQMGGDWGEFDEDAAMETIRRAYIGVLAYGPLGHGLLTGTMTRDREFPDGDWRAGSSVFRGEELERNLDAEDALSAFAPDRGISISHLATAWVLASPGVHVAIVGTRSAEHIAEAVAAADVKLSAEDLDRIDEIMAAAVQVGGPTPEGV